MIVAVDGPAGSGKSSVCSKVCDRIGWTYVNTGFLYRSVAFLARQAGYDWSDEDQLISVIDDFAKNYHWDPISGILKYKGQDITNELQSSEIGVGASNIAKLAKVRERLLPLQRELSLLSPQGAIVDGRDIGTVVFPDADLKIYLTANLDERARRRKAQLDRYGKGDSDLAQIKKDIELRDNQDKSRGYAPLKQADDAVVVDTSDMNVDRVVEELLGILKTRRLI